MKARAPLCASTSLLAAATWAVPTHAQQAAPPPVVIVPPAAAGPPVAAPPAAAPAPAAPQAASAAPPAATVPPPSSGGARRDVVVTGTRASLQSAQNLKRNSDGILDAVVAEDIGKLPDTLASSALQRVTGVQINRGAGEARDVQIRGLPDLSTTYNGREIFTAESRAVAIQDFPAGTVAALEVYKSGTAELIEGGIGGQVNVRGRKPFDFEGFELSGAINAIHWQESQKFSPNGSLLVSNRWQTGIGEIGVLANISYLQLDFADSSREQSLVIGTATPATAPGTPGGFRYPDGQAIYYNTGHRKRPAANFAIQWKPADSLEIYVDGLWQGFRGQDSNRQLFAPIFGDGLQLSDVTFRDGNSAIAETATVSGADPLTGFSSSSNADVDTYQIAGGAIWRKDGTQVVADVAYTDSRLIGSAYNIDYKSNGSPVRRAVFEQRGNSGGPAFSIDGFDPVSPASYLTRGFFQERIDRGGSDVQARLDVTQDLSEAGLLRRLQFGLRFNDRTADFNRGALFIETDTPTGPASVPLGSLPLDFRSTDPGFSYDDGLALRRFVAMRSASIRANLPALRQIYGAPAGDVPFNRNESFTAGEKTYTFYTQLKYGLDLGPVPIDGVVGLRAVRTRTQLSGTSREIDAGGNEVFLPDERSNNYIDWLPNASLRAQLADGLQLRFSYTQTRTRPQFFQLNPALAINPQSSAESFRTAGGGNPGLTPLNSDNYDVSVEWYFAKAGSLTAAVFRRDARGFIYTEQQTVDDPVYGPLRVSLPVNSGDTRFKGAEVGFTGFLDIDGLPEWAKGFGVQANGTYVDAKGDLSPDFNQRLGGVAQRFNGVSKWSYNLVALYEKPVFSARLAYNYRSDFVNYYSVEPLDVAAGAAPDDPLAGRVRGLVEKGRGQLDFSASVTPVPNLTLAFDVVNLIGNPIRRYRQFNDAGDQYARQILYLERTYSLGLRFRF